MDGYFEVILSDEQRSPDRVDIIGEVRGKIHYYPDTLVLPRQLAGKQLLTGELVFSHRDNKAIRLEAESVPEGISLTITPSELNQCKVHVEYNPKTSDNASIAMTHTTKIVQLRLKVTSYDKEISFVTIPLILIRQ